MKWLLVPVVLAVALASGAVSRGEAGAADRDACYEKFNAAGFSEQQAKESSDLVVLDICGFIPKYTVNPVWHVNRDRPTGAAEKAAELLACREALKSSPLELDAATASDEQLIRACGTVPALLD